MSKKLSVQHQRSGGIALRNQQWRWIESTFDRLWRCSCIYFVKDRDGDERDVILGYDNVSHMRRSTAIWCYCRRYANRISDAKVNIDGVEYKLEANDNENSLHSGSNGFSKRFWTVKEQKADEITFEIEDADLEQGFPGNAVVDVTFKDNRKENATC